VKMEARRSFETSVSDRNITRRHNSEDLDLNWENGTKIHTCNGNWLPSPRNCWLCLNIKSLGWRHDEVTEWLTIHVLLIGTRIVHVRVLRFKYLLSPYLLGKGKVVSVLLLFNWAPRHEGVLRKWRYSSTHSLTSALDGGEWSASRLGRFTPRERILGTHFIGGWVGPKAVLDAVVKRKIPSPHRESNPRSPIVQPVAERYTD
jgi:hypothetical protein